MPRRDDLSRAKAAQAYRDTGGNVTETARRAGVHRTTVHGWLKEPGFLETPPVDTAPGVSTYIPKAMSVIDDALSGKKITNNQIRAAIEVLKATNALKDRSMEDKATLADLIAKIDEEGSIESD